MIVENHTNTLLTSLCVDFIGEHKIKIVSFGMKMLRVVRTAESQKF